MPFIGNQPADKFLTLEKQVFTTSATDTYTLDREVSSVNDLELFLNNVRQEPTEAYTISGTTLTLASAITASDSMYCIYQGRAVGTQSPASGSVTNDMISYPLTESGATVSTFNRTTSDGTILDIQKDGTSVGSIGSAFSSTYYAGSNSGIRFASNALPTTGSGANSDNAVDLGISSVRWKDFYLAGNIYLGGTGSANALDDYEEGTWTGTLTGASTSPGTKITSTGVYKKVGSLVHIQIGFENYNGSGYSGQGSVEGLPFTNTSNSRVMINLGSYSALTWTDTLSGLIPQSGSQIEMFDFKSNDTWDSATLNSGTGNYFWITGTYSQA